MNTIYFGRRHGIDAAAQAYFGHGADQLTLSGVCTVGRCHSEKAFRVIRREPG